MRRTLRAAPVAAAFLLGLAWTPAPLSGVARAPVASAQVPITTSTTEPPPPSTTTTTAPPTTTTTEQPSTTTTRASTTTTLAPAATTTTRPSPTTTARGSTTTAPTTTAPAGDEPPPATSTTLIETIGENAELPRAFPFLSVAGLVVLVVALVAQWFLTRPGRRGPTL